MDKQTSNASRLLIEHHNYDSPKSNPFEQFSIERWAVMYRHISAQSGLIQLT
jgi:hypothetical protein